MPARNPVRLSNNFYYSHFSYRCLLIMVTVAASCAWLSFSALNAATLLGATLTVNSTADTNNPNDGLLTLREAILISNGTRAIGASADSRRVTVHAAGRGNPYISLRDGHDLRTEFREWAGTHLVTGAGVPQAQAMALAAGDFDEDGTTDLVTGYADGLLAWHRGNADTVYPHSPEAAQHKVPDAFTAEPFAATAFVTRGPVVPDFLAAGDFDADDHWDVVLTQRGATALYMLPGDGRGGFGPPRRIELPGAVTALTSGEVNRADGMNDLAVGIAGASGPQLLIFEAPQGALAEQPEVISLPAEAAAIELAQLDDGYEMDAAVAAGRELLIVHGRDRRAATGQAGPAQASPASVSRQPFAHALTALAVGDFTGSQRPAIAFLTADGAVHVVSGITAPGAGRAAVWQQETVFTGSWSAQARLVAAHVSSRPQADLVVFDKIGRQLQILTHQTAEVPVTGGPGQGRLRRAVALRVEGVPVAVLPMRLNADALSDLVVLKQGANPLAVVATTPTATFAVTHTGDSGNGSLRKAITDANLSLGADSIVFNLDAQAGPHTISPLTPLPQITETVTIDGTTVANFAGHPDVELNGAVAGNTAGLVCVAPNSVIRGLAINRFSFQGIFVGTNGGGTIIEGNYIGTDTTGTLDRGNAGYGIWLFQSSNNRVGGTVAAARNLISGNDNISILIDKRAAVIQNNQVLGNYIGTDATGTVALGNSDGLNIAGASNTVIGGTTAGARNVISGNTNFSSVAIYFGASGTLVQGNYIGTGATGVLPLGNSGAGIGIGDPDPITGTTIGGAAPGAANLIAYNGGRGVTIGGNTTGTLVQGNTITANNGTGVTVFSNIGHSILANSIFANAGLGIDLGGNGVTPNDCSFQLNCLDCDTGPNGLQNFPILSSVSTGSGGQQTVQGSLCSVPGISFTIQFFYNQECATRQGKRFVGSVNVTTDAVFGTASFNVTLPQPLCGERFITATATDNLGSTSEFSPCQEFEPRPPDLTLTKSHAGNFVIGSTGSYVLTVSSDPNDCPATGPITVSDGLPANLTLQGFGGAGWSCAGLGMANVSCTHFGPLAPGASLPALMLDVRVGNGTPLGVNSITNTATVSTPGETHTSDNTASDSTTVVCPAISVEPTLLPNGFLGAVYNRTLSAVGGAVPYSFTISGGALPPGLAITSGALSGTPTVTGTFNFMIKATDANGCMATRPYTVIISGNGLQFYPLAAPVRLLETRAGFSGCMTPGAPINANGTLTLPARTTCAGIPANAAAVTGNLTVVPSGPGFLTLFPSSATQPTVANSNFQTNEITNNVFTVGLGAGDGAFKIFSSATTNVIVDVTGYYAPPGTGGLFFHALATPVRLLETRLGFTGCSAPGTPLTGTGNPNADPNLDLLLQGRSPVAAPCNSIPATAQVLVGNATSVLPGGGGYLTIYPSGGTRPTVASSNYAGGDVINGPFAVKLGVDGKFKIYTFATTHLVVDILGYYSEDATDANGAGLLFNPLPSPVRLLETRVGFNGCTMTGAPIVGNLSTATHTQMAANFCGLPAAAQAVVGNVSAVNTTGAGFLTLFPANLATAPLVATSNYPAPATFGYNRHFFVGLSSVDGKFKVLTQFTTDLILDASGYFAP